MSYPIADLRAMSESELITRHDELAQTTVAGVNYYLEELARRDTAAATNTMVRLTWVIAALTLVITVLTVVSLIAVLSE